MKREDVVYFGAGPAGLPTDVLSTAADALQNYDGTGLSVYPSRLGQLLTFQGAWQSTVIVANWRPISSTR